jgi:hypothetical protein
VKPSSAHTAFIRLGWFTIYIFMVDEWRKRHTGGVKRHTGFALKKTAGKRRFSRCLLSCGALCSYFVKISSISSSIKFAATTPPAVFQIASSTLCTSPFLDTSKFLNSGSSIHSFSNCAASPSPTS